MFYWIAGIIGGVIIALGIAGGGAYVANTYCKAGIYKAQVHDLQRQLANTKKLNELAQNEENKDTKVENSNKDFIDDIRKAIGTAPDNSECANVEFLRKLRLLQ